MLAAVVDVLPTSFTLAPMPITRYFLASADTADAGTSAEIIETRSRDRPQIRVAHRRLSGGHTVR